MQIVLIPDPSSTLLSYSVLLCNISSPSFFCERLGTVSKYRSAKTTIRIALNTIEQYEFRDQTSSLSHLFRILERAVRFVFRSSVVVLS